jgi:hypothetical protein
VENLPGGSSYYEEIDDARAFELCEKARKIVEQIIAVDPANVQRGII